MLTAFNAAALVVTLAAAYMSWVLGVYRAAMALASCVIAGAIAFGLYGPLSSLLPGAGNLRSVWYYAGDAVALWGLFSAVFLVLRTAADKLLREQPGLPHLVDRGAGAVLGLGTGYLAVGMCLISVQMLPLNPDDVLGAYSPFKYDGAHNTAIRGPDLWLKWDRGTLAFFDYLSARSLGSEGHAIFGRYGRVYGVKAEEPPKAAGQPETAAESNQAKLPKEAPTADDFLYYHWYRRWEYVWWNTGCSRGPIPDDYPPQPGVGLAPGRTKILGDVQVRIVSADTARKVDFFDQERLGGDQQFLIITMILSPGAAAPATIDSDQFVLVGPNKDRCAKPLVYDFARSVDGKSEIVERTSMPAEAALRDPRFSVPDVRREGRALASGATFTFKNSKQTTLQTFIFVAPKGIRLSDLRVLVEPLAPAPAPPKAAAPKSTGG
jgi:hypothetical protein